MEELNASWKEPKKDIKFMKESNLDHVLGYMVKYENKLGGKIMERMTKYMVMELWV